MSFEKKNAPQLGRRDTAIMEEIEVLLGDYEFNRNQFVEFVVNMEPPIVAASIKQRELDRANIFKFFNGRTVPLYALLRIADHLCCFEIEISPDDPRLAEYQDRAWKIKAQAVQYVIEHKSDAHSFRPVIREFLQGLSTLEIERFFNGIYVLNFSERVWAFWLCYACLNGVGQQYIRELLVKFPMSPQLYARRLTELHKWEMEVNAPLALKVKRALSTYSDQSKKDDPVKTQKRLVEALVDLLQNYSYPYDCNDVALRFVERTDYQLNADDWAILSMYSLLCSALNEGEQQEIDQSMYEYIANKALINNRCPEAVSEAYRHRFYQSSIL